MKITSSRKEDILRRKAEYEADFARRKAEYSDQARKYHEAEESVYAPVREALENLFKKYPLLDAEIRVEDGRFGEDSLRVTIRVSERSKFEDKVSLSWSYDAYFNNGELVRETNSWSGMKAVTPDQLEHLEQCLSALKDLAVVDWDDLLKRKMPEYKDYITVKNPEWETKPDFKKELREAELEDIIGERKLIEVKAFPSSWYYPSYQMRVIPNVFVAIVKDSGTQYTIKEVSKYMMDKGMDEVKERFDNEATHRVKKSQIVPVDPINIIDVPE